MAGESNLPGLLDRSLLFVTGKGGVGKTTTAAALGLLAAKRGHRALVCAMEQGADLAGALGTSALSYRPRQVSPGLFAMEMDTEAALREYLRLNLHLPAVGRVGSLAEAFDFVATAAPGVREILTVGKLCYEVREGNYDLIVVDSTATGHIVGHLAAPVGINDLVRVGAIREQTRWMLEILESPSKTGVVIVTTPEETPINESLELIGELKRSTSVRLAAVVANRLLPELFGRSEEEAFERICTVGTETIARSLKTSAMSVEEVFDAARVAVGLRRAGAVHIDRLRAGLSDDVPLLLLPLLFARAQGPRAVRRLADALEEEL